MGHTEWKELPGLEGAPEDWGAEATADVSTGVKQSLHRLVNEPSLDTKKAKLEEKQEMMDLALEATSDVQQFGWRAMLTRHSGDPSFMKTILDAVKMWEDQTPGIRGDGLKIVNVLNDLLGEASQMLEGVLRKGDQKHIGMDPVFLGAMQTIRKFPEFTSAIGETAKKILQKANELKDLELDTEANRKILMENRGVFEAALSLVKARPNWDANDIASVLEQYISWFAEQDGKKFVPPEKPRSHVDKAEYADAPLGAEIDLFEHLRGNAIALDPMETGATIERLEFLAQRLRDEAKKLRGAGAQIRKIKYEGTAHEVDEFVASLRRKASPDTHGTINEGRKRNDRIRAEKRKLDERINRPGVKKDWWGFDKE